MPVLPIKRIEIEDFRGIGKLDIPLHRRLTVFYGLNADGKTTVLDALAAGLGPLAALIPGSETRGVKMKPRGDIRAHWFDGKDEWTAPFCRVTLHGADETAWDVTRLRDQTDATRKQAGRSLGQSGLRECLAPIITDIQEGRGALVTLPVCAYYGAERGADEPRKREVALPESPRRFDAFQGSLSRSRRLATASDLFRLLEEDELRVGRERRDVDYRSPMLAALRQAIEKVLPHCSAPRILREPLRLVVDYAPSSETAGEVLEVSQLSDGYRSLLAMVMDLGLRMLTANPAHPQRRTWGLEEHAIVLIDEIDLHLHPSWQQDVLPHVLSAFPRAQFVVTTHSDQVLSSVDDRDYLIYQLRREGGQIVAGSPPMQMYSVASEEILKVGMDVEARPPNEVRDDLDRYMALVDKGEGETETARSLRERLDAWKRDDPALHMADLRINRKKVMARESR